MISQVCREFQQYIQTKILPSSAVIVPKPSETAESGSQAQTEASRGSTATPSTSEHGPPDLVDTVSLADARSLSDGQDPGKAATASATVADDTVSPLVRVTLATVAVDANGTKAPHSAPASRISTLSPTLAETRQQNSASSARSPPNQ